MPNEGATARCPFCAEHIPTASERCPACGERLRELLPPGTPVEACPYCGVTFRVPHDVCPTCLRQLREPPPGPQGVSWITCCSLVVLGACLLSAILPLFLR